MSSNPAAAHRPAIYPDAPKYFGLALIGSGVLALVISIWQYRTVVDYLWKATFAPIAGIKGTTKVQMQLPIMVVAALLVCIGLSAFFAVLLRLS